MKQNTAKLVLLLFIANMLSWFFLWINTVNAATVSYNFESDTIGVSPSNIIAENCSFQTTNSPYLSGNSLATIPNWKSVCNWLLSSFPSASDYSIVWKSAGTSNSTTTQIYRNGFILRAQPTPYSVFTDWASRAWYLFTAPAWANTSFPNNSARIYRFDRTWALATQLGTSVSLPPPLAGIARWYRATVSWTNLTFEYSNTSSAGPWISIMTQTDTTYTSWYTVYTDYNLATQTWVVDDIEMIYINTTIISPDLPKNLTWSIWNSQIVLSWNAPVVNGGSAITDYIVEYKTTASSTWNTFSDGTSAANTATVTWLTNGTSYDFRISAVNSVWTSSPSSAISLTPVFSATAPSAPTWLLANTSSWKTLLNWTPPASNGGSAIIDYIVEYKTTASSTWNTFSDGTSAANTATVTWLTNGTSYDFRVSAVNSVWTSSPSTTVSVIPNPVILHNILIGWQSLSVWAAWSPALSTNQPFTNKMLNASMTTLIPLIEPHTNAYLGTDTSVETMASAFSNWLSSSITWYTSMVSMFWEPWVAYTWLKKWTNSYTKSIQQATAWKNLANSWWLYDGYSIDAVTIVHGETDYKTNTTAATYVSNLLEWQSDYQTDINTLLGTNKIIPLFHSQMSSATYYPAWYASNNNASAGPILAQWTASRDNPTKIILVGPKYFLDYSDGVHLNNYSYRRLGEYYAKVMKKVIVDGQSWLPLSPKEITMSGNVVTAKFNVPVEPLVIDTIKVDAKKDYGFEFTSSGGTATISWVTLIDTNGNGLSDAAQITLSWSVWTTPKLAYAYSFLSWATLAWCSGSVYWAGAHKSLSQNCDTVRGNIRDSDSTPSYYQDSSVPATMWNQLNNWMITFNESITTTPSAPTSISATAGNTQATVTFTAPTNNGGSAITEYTVTSSPGGITATGTTSPITVTGLTNGTSYTFTVTAKNTVGTSAASTASTAVIPTAPDTTAPVVTLVWSGTINILRNTSYTDSGATWSDNVDGTGSILNGIWNGTGSFTMSGSVNTSLAWSYSIQYQKVDAAWNKSAIVTRTVIVNPLTYTVDFKDYDWSLLKTQTGVIEWTSATAPSNPTRTGYSFASWSGSYDNIQANTDIVATYTINQYTLTFDSVGWSTVSSIVQDYNSSVTPPTNPTKTGYTFAGWSPNLPTTMPSANGTHTANWTANSYTVSFDANGGDGTMTSQSFVYDIAQSLLSNIFTRTGYNFLKWNTQSNGGGTNYNDGESVTNLTSVNGWTVTLYSEWEDIESPVISANGSLNMIVEVGSTYIDPGATALDNKDGDISSSIITNGTVDTATLWSYTLTYDVTDAEWNVATTVTRAVTVVDTTKPVVTLLWDPTIDILKNTSYTDSGATWSDNVDGTGNISSYSGSVTTTQTGSYELWYRHTDTANNTSTIVKRTVNVISWNAPVITLIWSGTVTIAQWANYTDSGATVFDSEDGDITANIISSGSVNTSQVGTYTIQYSITDTQDNTVIMERTINVTDQTAPVITLSWPSAISVTQWTNYIDLWATWVDNVDGTGSLIASGNVDTNIPWNYTLTYSKTDTAGNTGAMVTRIVTVIAPQSFWGGGGWSPSKNNTIGLNTVGTNLTSTINNPLTPVDTKLTNNSLIDTNKEVSTPLKQALDLDSDFDTVWTKWDMNSAEKGNQKGVTISVENKEVPYTYEPKYNMSEVIQNINKSLIQIKDTSFSDIYGSPFEGVINLFNTLWLVNGTKDNLFEPNRSVTRAEFTKLLLVSHGLSYDEIDTSKNRYTDLDETAWQARAVLKATEIWLVNGMKNENGETIFEPNRPITKIEMTKMLINMSRIQIQKSNNTKQYLDIEIDWQTRYAQIASTLWLSQELSDDYFGTKDNVSRWEALNNIQYIINLYK
jgi:hypothetical protein